MRKNINLGDRADLSTSPVRLLDHLTDAVRSGVLSWGSSCALDWVRLLDDAALAGLASLDERIEEHLDDGNSTVEQDALGVVLVLRLMESGGDEELSLPIETILLDIQVLSLIACLVKYERAGACRVVEPIRLSDNEHGKVVLWLSERMRALLSAPYN